MRDNPLHRGDTWEESHHVVIVDFFIWVNVRSSGVTTVEDQGTLRTFAGVNQASKREYWMLE